MKSNPLSFYRLIFLSLFGGFINKMQNIKNVNQFPKKINGYTFVKEFQKNSSVVPFYHYGIYKNETGKKAFAKMWTGSYKNYSYYTLRNEIIVYSLINRVLKRSLKTLPKDLKDVKIPQILDFKDKDKSLLILLEFVQGSNSESLSEKEKVNVYFKAVDFYRFISDKLTEKEKLLLSKRTAKNYIIIYPFVMLKAIINYPRYSASFFRSIPIFISSIPYLITNNDLVLTQRDLQFKNILFYKKKIILIDLEMCVLTNPLAEFANTLRSVSNNKRLFKLLLREVNKRYYKKDNYKTELAGLGANITTHSLIDKTLPYQLFNKDINFLQTLSKGVFI